MGVSEHLVIGKGAVCAEVAIAMAEGALKRSPADLAVAVTGVMTGAFAAAATGDSSQRAHAQQAKGVRQRDGRILRTRWSI